MPIRKGTKSTASAVLFLSYPIPVFLGIFHERTF